MLFEETGTSSRTRRDVNTGNVIPRALNAFLETLEKDEVPACGFRDQILEGTIRLFGEPAPERKPRRRG